MPSTPPVPAGPLKRTLTAAGSLMLLAGLIAGLPGALVRFAGNPLPDGAPTVESVGSALTSPDDGSLLLDVLAVIGWLAWAGFAVTVVLEVLARLRRRAVPAIPGLRGPQRFASVLVAAVAALSATPTFTSASAAVVQAPAPVTALVEPVDPVDPAGSGREPGTAEQPTPAAESVLHLVARGEALLDLQDRYGVPWQRIAEANHGVAQPDGRSLRPGQTRIYPGWQLRIPAMVTPAPQSHAPGQATPVTGFGSADQLTDPAETDQRPVYEVAEDDWLWYVADRYLGDPERYRDIAALNPELADRHGDFPDHIEPGWTVTLPEDAVDGGPTAHATGTATPIPEGEPDPPPEADLPEIPADEQPVPPRAQPTDPPDESAPEEAAPAKPEEAAPEQPTRPAEPEEPTVATGLGTAPDNPDERTGDAAGASDEPDLERLAPVALASAGLLTALVLGAAALHRHRRNQHHQPGFRFVSPAARRLEKALRSAQQPLDVSRLDAALRGLAAGLAGRTGTLPDIAGALVDDGSVHLLLASPCPDPPAPWRDHQDRWTLPAGAVLPAAAGAAAPLAPLPTLAAIGSQAGIHLLLDLERLGFLTVHGDQARALDLLRYLAAELACNSWSDTAEILLAGFDPRETELLVTLNPDRVRALPSVPDAVARLRYRIESARATLGHAGATDAFAGRIHSLAGDAWMPQVLLAVARSPADLAALRELARDLDGAARCAVAVAAAAAGAVAPPPDRSPVSVTPDGMVQVRLPFLQASLAAASLSAAELAPLAETMRAARTDPQLPVPPAPEPDPWATGSDAAGAARMVGRATVGAGAPVRGRDGDPSLDEELREWYAETSARPRIAILGPVFVDAPGTVPQIRRRLHTELIVFLAQRAGRGAQAPLIDAALWPDSHIADAARQLAISRARQWLGTAPDGAPWLPDLGRDLAYRLADGYLFDWHLFRRLRTRGETQGAGGAADLRAALELVRGVPLDRADRPRAPGTRNPYPWLSESDIHPGHLAATIVDTAHQLAELSLVAGDPVGARWAVQQAWLADSDRSYDQPWRDLLRAEHADGRTDQLRAVLAELMEVRDAEAPEDLAPDTYRLISCWPPNVLVPAG